MIGNGRNWIKPAILAGVLIGAGGLGVAAAKSGDSGHGHCGASHRSHMFGNSWVKPGRYVEGKLAFLKTELKIRDDQAAAWQAFAAVVRDTDAARAGSWKSRHGSNRSVKDREHPALDERIDRGLAAMEERLKMLRTLAVATKTLYGELDGEQQKIADALLHRRPGHGRGFRF